MNILLIFFSILTASFLGIIGVFLVRYFRVNHEKNLQLKLAIQNSKKIEVEAEEEELEGKNLGKKKKRAEEKIIEEKKEEIKKTVSEKDFSTLIAKANLHISRKEFSDAEKILIEVLSFDGDYIPALEKLGHIYLETKSFSKSKLLYERLIEEFPKNPNVHTNYALSLFYEKEFEKSVESYETAKNLDPNNALRYANLGQVFFAVKNFTIAIEYFAESIKLEPRNIEYLFLLADTFKTCKRFAEAKKWYEKILELSPYDAEAKKEIERFEALGF